MENNTDSVPLTREEVLAIIQECYRLFEEILLINGRPETRPNRYVRPFNPHQNPNNTNKYWREKRGNNK